MRTGSFRFPWSNVIPLEEVGRGGAGGGGATVWTVSVPQESVTVCPTVDGTVTLLVAGVDAPTGPTAKRSMADRTTAPKAVANFNIFPSCLAAPTGKDEA